VLIDDDGDDIDSVDNVVDYQTDANTKQQQLECEDISDELYRKHMEWVAIFKRHTTPSHENQDEKVVIIIMCCVICL